MSKTIEMKASFSPTAKMKTWVMERVLPENIQLSDHGLLMKLGYSKNLLWNWKTKYGGAWDAWYDLEVQGRKDAVKAILKHVGMRRAVAGDYRYWRHFAKAYGVLS